MGLHAPHPPFAMCVGSGSVGWIADLRRDRLGRQGSAGTSHSRERDLGCGAHHHSSRSLPRETSPDCGLPKNELSAGLTATKVAVCGNECPLVPRQGSSSPRTPEASLSAGCVGTLFLAV